LKQDAHKTLFLPTEVGLTAKKGGDERRPAKHFPSLDGQVDLRAALVAADDFELDAEGFLQQARDVIAGRACP
jgi:hypothetical protein